MGPNRSSLFRAVGCALGMLFGASAVPAQDAPPIDWQPGPVVGRLGGFAEITVPEGYLFADRKGAQKLLELSQNIVVGNEVGAIVPAAEGPENDWFVVFQFNEIGFVTDEEKDEIDAAKLLESLREATDAANQERRKRGWSTMRIVGWEREPYYDPGTNNLTWAIRAVSEGEQTDGSNEAVNHSVRLLGRRGTMDADLVLDPMQYGSTIPRFENLMQGFVFREGHRYADFVQGDQLAAYGLTALIAGGAGAAAVKSGFLAQFWKVLVGLLLVLKKAILLAIVGAFALLAKIWRSITGRSRKSGDAAVTSAAGGSAGAER